MLHLGPLHSKVQTYLEAVIANPGILLPPQGSYKTGTMDGELWESPEVMEVIYNMGASLPHLQPVLVAFFKGSLATWVKFTSEFKEGGLIDQATAEEKEKAWMPPTNDVNEGALEAYQVVMRRQPWLSKNQFNAWYMAKSIKQRNLYKLC